MTLKQWLAWIFESIAGWRPYVEMSRKSGEVYMRRWQLLKTRLLSIYINHIRLPDEDPWLHTHPWRKSWSLKLKGSYLEELRNGYRIPKRFSRIPGMHRIIHLSDGGAWTLFIGWRSDHPWGFVDPKDGRVVSWRERAKMRELPMSAFSGGQNR